MNTTRTNAHDPSLPGYVAAALMIAMACIGMAFFGGSLI